MPPLTITVNDSWDAYFRTKLKLSINEAIFAVRIHGREKYRHQQTYRARIAGKDFFAGLRHEKLIVLCGHMRPLSRDRIGNDQIISFEARNGPIIVQSMQGDGKDQEFPLNVVAGCQIIFCPHYLDFVIASSGPSLTVSKW